MYTRAHHANCWIVHCMLNAISTLFQQVYSNSLTKYQYHVVLVLAAQAFYSNGRPVVALATSSGYLF